MQLLRVGTLLAGIGLAFSAYTQSPVPSVSSGSKGRSIVGAPGAPVIDATTPPNKGSPTQTKALAGQAAAGKAAGFVTQASESGIAEVEFSKVALGHASNSKVREFATTTIDDHTKANKQLLAVAAMQGVQGESNLTAEHAASVKKLSQMSGAAFDKAYLAQMTADHQKDIALFQQEAEDSNAELASFASKTLPMLQHHAAMVESLQRRHGH